MAAVIAIPAVMVRSSSEPQHRMFRIHFETGSPLFSYPCCAGWEDTGILSRPTACQHTGKGWVFAE